MVEGRTHLDLAVVDLGEEDRTHLGHHLDRHNHQGHPAQSLEEDLAEAAVESESPSEDLPEQEERCSSEVAARRNSIINNISIVTLSLNLRFEFGSELEYDREHEFQFDY